MSSFLNICCGSQEEERKPSAFERGPDDWLSGQKEHIHTVEDQLTLLSKSARSTHHDAEARKTIFTPTVNLEEDYEAPSFPKSDQEKEFLLQALKDNFLFTELSSEELDKLVGAMSRETFKRRDHIITQGDVENLFFYVVESGEIDFILDETKNVGSCSMGGSFGELALLYGSPRAVSCVVGSDKASVWKVDQTTFRYLLAHHSHEYKSGMRELLKKVSIFTELSDEDLSRFADTLTPVHWKKGDRIVQKGEEGKVFYILREGTAKVHDIGLGDSQSEDLVLGPGDWFGERALLTGEPRAANVTALSDVITMAMDRDTFETVIGPLQSCLEREMRLSFLKGRPIFADGSVSKPELLQLADLMKEVEYKKGETLAEDGSVYPMKIWFIRHGRLLVIGSRTEKIYNLATGDCFGDKSVRGDPNRISSHTAICESDLTTWVLTRSDIENVVGDISRLGEASLGFVKSAQDPTIRLSDLKRHTVIGEGAFGRVWLVSNKKQKDGGSFALKMINKRKLIKTKQVHSVLREKEMLCLLQHPFILSLISSFQDDYYIYLLLPVISGGELFSVLHSRADRRGGLPNFDAAFYAACILEALGHFHQRSIAYRDLKLENVLINSDGYCVVVDLGFAKVVPGKTYTLVGTPEYLAPEIILSKGHDKAVDYWAFGVLVYELLVGRSPFFVPNTSQVEMFRRAVKMEYSFPAVLISQDAQDLITSLLQRRLSKRLGNLAGGYHDVKKSVWFSSAGVDFRSITQRETEAPWIPSVQDELDASNFDSYDERQDDDETAYPLSAEEQEQFKDF